jgi:hypothetical protein
VQCSECIDVGTNSTPKVKSFCLFCFLGAFCCPFSHHPIIIIIIITYCRSKLHATEAAVQSVVDPADFARLKPKDESNSLAEPGTPSRRSAASEARLTPSRIPKLSSTSPRTSTGGAALSLRERLAAAQKNRAKAAASESEESARSSSAYGHAAALRARLEAVKQQSNRDAS